MFQRFAIFTIKKTMKATIMNVINATKKSPMPNDCFVTVMNMLTGWLFLGWLNLIMV